MKYDFDPIDWIRAELQRQPAVLSVIEPVLTQARITYGGDRVYIRSPPRPVVSIRTLQRRNRVTVRDLPRQSIP